MSNFKAISFRAALSTTLISCNYLLMTLSSAPTCQHDIDDEVYIKCSFLLNYCLLIIQSQSGLSEPREFVMFLNKLGKWLQLLTSIKSKIKSAMYIHV